NITSQQVVTEPQEFVSNADGNTDVFFANANGNWAAGYAAQHAGILNGWNGTGEQVTLTGKNKLADIFEGSDDANILVMSDAANGDALFMDDIYTALPGTIDEQQARIAQIDEIRAGVGDDIVDMTSQRFEYVGDGVKIYGGLGNDTIWANNGNNTLFGDAGNDRIVGGANNDVIIGGIGNDSLHGGGGNDIFCFGGDWGTDTIEQLDGGEITLWFESGSENNWNADTLTYTDGTNSVKVSGISADNISLKFGNDSSDLYDELAISGCFDDAASEKIFEDKNKGMLA
ncbi:MAG: calcium-binding protein, partial [Bacillota bacterium]